MKGDKTTVANQYTYIADGYHVLFRVDDAWNENFQATVTLSNTRKQVMEDWYLTFELEQAEGKRIWTALI